MSLNILIVDDSKIMRKIILKTIGISGLPLGEVSEASNGREGLAILEKKQIDLVMVDINMPVMNGEEMIEEMSGNPAYSKIPVAVISTEGSSTRISRLLSKGVVFIHKPFTPEVFRDSIQKLTGTGGQK